MYSCIVPVILVFLPHALFLTGYAFKIISVINCHITNYVIVKLFVNYSYKFDVKLTFIKNIFNEFFILSILKCS